MESEIDKAEKVISSMSISDANMRLMLNMARLTDTVSALSSTASTLTVSVGQLTQDVNGVQGVRSEMKDIRRDQQDQKRDLLEMEITIADARKFLWRIVWFLALIGFVTIISDVRLLAPSLTEGFKP